MIAQAFRQSVQPLKPRIPACLTPDKPTDNAFIEALNSKLQAECLNAHRFMSFQTTFNSDAPMRRTAMTSLLYCVARTYSEFNSSKTNLLGKRRF